MFLSLQSEVGDASALVGEALGREQSRDREGMRGRRVEQETL